MNSTDKCAFICHIDKPTNTHKRIIVAAPPLAEHEKGFEMWMRKVSKLAQEFSIPVHIYCNQNTGKMVEKCSKKIKTSANIQVILFDDWEDFLVLSRNIHQDDLIILVSSRRGAPSYMPVLESLPAKLEKHFKTNSRIIIYPQQYNIEQSLEGFEDVNAETLNKGLETVQRIGRKIGGIFRKEESKVTSE